MGSRHSAATLRLREFLGRNGYPYTYVDLDSDKTSQELLDRFAVKLEDVPIVICHTGAHCATPRSNSLQNASGSTPALTAQPYEM